MATGGSKSAAIGFLILNFLLYGIITIIASWAVNHGIERSREAASVLSIPARIFPIYFPVGNMASGFFIIYSLIAGVVGMVSSIISIINVIQWNPSNLHAAAASSLITWLLTLLAMGLACKEINIGWADSTLRALEALTIIVSATQLLCMGMIQGGVENVERLLRIRMRG
ncbi:membrane protein PM19L [Vitis riparia]|uniref:membrane protein PM19L n=1 Tax=Vitis riparia TaxID=96939 RepID=UPI00155ABEDB|nr:membrane protein PM19L [Vitis riparia]